jgi:undecaprenyl-phosphate 4-deoxy-4-formamido-L-arabinose transferase
MEIFITVIIPTYNASGTIRPLVEQLETELYQYNFRIILIDDASSDNTRDIILSLAEDRPNIDYCFAARNKGQQASLLAGLKMISEPCKYVVTMDDDLQNPASVIPSLIEKIESGYDLVYAIPTIGRSTCYRAPSGMRRLGSRFRDLLFDSFVKKPPGIKVSAFRIISYELAQRIAASDKRFFYLSAEAFQYDIQTANINYEYVPRAYGQSSYHFGKLLLVYLKLLITYKLKMI